MCLKIKEKIDKGKKKKHFDTGKLTSNLEMGLLIFKLVYVRVRVIFYVHNLSPRARGSVTLGKDVPSSCLVCIANLKLRLCTLIRR